MIKLVVGLGNPGRKYQNTRHNLGFQVLNLLAKKHKAKPAKGFKDVSFFEISVSGRKLYLAKPQTFMNGSGVAVRQALEKWKLLPDQMLVVCDDISLPVGKIRIRPGGSDGGHRGLRSISAQIGTADFSRLKLGVGPLPEGYPAEKFVLEPFLPDEKEKIKEMMKMAVACTEFAVKVGIEESMNRFN